MAVGGLGKEFAAGLLDNDEGFGGRCGVSENPADAFVGGIINALVGDGDYLTVIWDKVAESPAAATAVAGNPGDTTVCGVFNAVIGRVDSNQLVAVGD